MLKQLRLLTASLGSDGVLTWMGSEFGQVDSADMPRLGNGETQMSISYSSADDKGLKFKHLDAFDLCLNRTMGALDWLSDPKHTILLADEERKLLVYARGDCVFAFNFHPAEACFAWKVD